MKQLSQTARQTAHSWAILGVVVLFLSLVGNTAQAQSKVSLGEQCFLQADCDTGLLCTKVGAISVCLLACPSGQCLTSETCQSNGQGQKVCMCDTKNPCKGGLPCINGICPAFSCEPKTRPCPSGTPLTCYQPIPNVAFGLCLEECTKDSDCPPPGTRCIPYKNKKICYCRQDSDCKTGLTCVDHHCHDPCTKDSDCPKKQFCAGKICEPKALGPPGESTPDEPGADTAGREAGEPLQETMMEPISEVDGGTDKPASQDTTIEPPTDTGRDVQNESARERKEEKVKDNNTTSTDVTREKSQDSALVDNSSNDRTTDQKPPPVCGCSSTNNGGFLLLFLVLLTLARLDRKEPKRG